MTYQQLADQLRKKSSMLCVGLDTDINKIPAHLQKEKDPLFTFNKAIIDATADYCVAYKPNLAFYEAQGARGWESLEKTLEYIPEEIFTIADAKRGDIGNTAGLYAKAFFENMNFDSVTIAPYMGRDSVDPFLAYKDKWAILLARTSNSSSKDFQELVIEDEYLYQHVIKKSSKWAGPDQLMYVVGATQPQSLKLIRQMIPEHFLLIPGVGAQGGSIAEVCEAGLNEHGGLLINSSRQILYASGGKDFAAAASQQAKQLQQEMAVYLNQ